MVHLGTVSKATTVRGHGGEPDKWIWKAQDILVMSMRYIYIYLLVQK